MIKIIIISVIIIIAISFLTKKDNKIPISFEEKLKAAFGDPDEQLKYGYDEECRECDNWDEVSEDCYCEDDCLTCDKPDQDKKAKETEAVQIEEEPAEDDAPETEETAE